MKYGDYDPTKGIFFFQILLKITKRSLGLKQPLYVFFEVCMKSFIMIGSLVKQSISNKPPVKKFMKLTCPSWLINENPIVLVEMWTTEIL